MQNRSLVILFEHSLNSDWVMSEIREARKLELYENRRKLFPVSITNFDTIKKWACFDPDYGQDLAKKIREYFIPDFSDWKNHATFQPKFKKLLEALEKDEKPASPDPPAAPTNLRRVG